MIKNSFQIRVVILLLFPQKPLKAMQGQPSTAWGTQEIQDQSLEKREKMRIEKGLKTSSDGHSFTWIPTLKATKGLVNNSQPHSNVTHSLLSNFPLFLLPNLLSHSSSHLVCIKAWAAAARASQERVIPNGDVSEHAGIVVEEGVQEAKGGLALLHALTIHQRYQPCSHNKR
jgi:hypothetical protein